MLTGGVHDENLRGPLCQQASTMSGYSSTRVSARVCERNFLGDKIFFFFLSVKSNILTKKRAMRLPKSTLEVYKKGPNKKTL